MCGCVECVGVWMCRVCGCGCVVVCVGVLGVWNVYMGGCDDVCRHVSRECGV